jgi:hypothetical protein
MPLLIELDNITQGQINRVSHTQSQDLTRYKWNEKYGSVFYKRLDDSVGNIFWWGIQDSFANGKVEEAVNMLYGVIKRVGREMVTKIRQYIEGDYWYDKQCKRKKREVKLALNEHKRKSDGENRSKYCKCKREYVNLLDDKKQRWQERNSEKMNYMIKHRYARKIWTTLRKLL